MKIPILLDTDIGSDIDDAVALAYLLRQPRCELVGITTVTGDVQQRAALAEIICNAAGCPEVPIYCGRRDVLLEGKGQPNVPQYAAVSHLPHRLERAENEAVEFLRTAIRKRPGEITLLTIGPYSNIALLFALDPEIPFLLKSIVSMGAQCFAEPFLEWNVRCDPTAAAMVYASKRPKHTTIGLDVTLPCRMSAKEVQERFAGEPLRTVVAMAETWFEHARWMTFHDPLAAAVIFHPELCTFDTGTLRVQIHEDIEVTGISHFTPSPSGIDRAAKTVDVEGFFREFFRTMQATI